MKHIFACSCGCEEEVAPEVFSLGYVYQCPSCQKIWACVMTRMGPKVWISVDQKEAEFKQILEEPENEDE